MVCGIFSVTIGWCCYSGTITSLASIILGIVALNQIKNQPELQSGKSMAIVGIVLGAAYYVIIAIIIVIYGAAILAGGLK